MFSQSEPSWRLCSPINTRSLQLHRENCCRGLLKDGGKEDFRALLPEESWKCEGLRSQPQPVPSPEKTHLQETHLRHRLLGSFLLLRLLPQAGSSLKTASWTEPAAVGRTQAPKPCTLTTDENLFLWLLLASDICCSQDPEPQPSRPTIPATPIRDLWPCAAEDCFCGAP